MPNLHVPAAKCVPAAFILIGICVFSPIASGQSFTGFSSLNSPSIVPAISPAASPVYSPEAGVSCPTPALTIASYGSNADNWVNYPGSTDARSGLGNFGVVAGVNIPFGGSLSRYCKDYASGLLKQQQEDAISRRINNQARLVNTCLALKNSVDFSDKAFDTTEFESLRDCRILQSSFRPPSAAPGAQLLPKGDGLETTPKPNVQLFLPIR